MTSSEKVKAYVEKCLKGKKSRNIIQGVMPEFRQMWRTPKGMQYWSSKTCKRTYDPAKNSITVRPGRNVKSAYVHYIPEYDMLEFSIAEINNKTEHTDGERIEWELTEDRVFLIKGDPEPYDSNGCRRWDRKNGYDYNREFSSYLHLLNAYFCHGEDNPQWDEIEKFCGYKVSLNDLAFCCRYMDDKNISEGFGKPTLSESEVIEKCSHVNCPAEKISFTSCFEKLNDHLCVFRFIKAREEKRKINDFEKREFIRLYVSDKGETAFMVRCGSSWYRSLEEPQSLIVNPEDSKGQKPISYIYDIAFGPDGMVTERIERLLNHPVIEQLYKSGYVNIAGHLMKAGDFDHAYKEVFGDAAAERGSLYSSTCCTREMLSVINERDLNSGNIGRTFTAFKDMFGEDYMSFSKERFKKYLSFFAEVYSAEPFGCDWKRILFGNDILTEEKKRLVERLSDIDLKGRGYVFEVFRDTVGMAERLGVSLNGELFKGLRSENDIIRLHNRLAEQLQTQEGLMRIERVKVTFLKLQEKRREDFNYEDDRYLIRVPESLKEIREEGFILSHCVASYMERHGLGKTDILFLREKGNPDKPFFTIQVQNGKVVQIHGSHNRWLGCSPKAIPFVYEWIQLKGLSCDEKILLNKAMGYSPSSKMLTRDHLFRKKKAA